MIDLESRNDPFQPFMTWGNKRSFLPIDLIDEEILYLSSILDEDFPPILKARISDIYGCIRHRKIKNTMRLLLKIIS